MSGEDGKIFLQAAEILVNGHVAQRQISEAQATLAKFGKQRSKREPLRVTVQRLRAENDLLVKGLNAYRDTFDASRGMCRGGGCNCRVHAWEREFQEFVASTVRYCIATKTNP